MALRDRRARHRSTDGQRPTASSGDDGCLLVLLLVLWSFGYVSFNWRREPDATSIAAVQAQIASAEAQLSELTQVITALREEANAVGARRDQLNQQVQALQSTRDELASSLETAAMAVAPSQSSRWRRMLEPLFTGVIGNLISAAVLVGLGWVFGRFRRRSGPEPAV